MTEEDFKEYCDTLGARPSVIMANLNHTPLGPVSGPEQVNFLHGAIGLATEAGELLDNAKKFMVYGRKIDRENALEEVGDCLHYLQYICTSLEFSMADAREKWGV